MPAIQMLRRHRTVGLAVTDGIAWVAAFVLVAAMRLDTFTWSESLLMRDSNSMIPIWGVLLLGVAAALLHVGLGLALRLHQGRALIGSSEEAVLLGVVTGTVGLVITVANAALPSLTPRSVPIAAAVVCVVIILWTRAVGRRIISPTPAYATGDRSVRVLVIGAGNGGRQLVESMLRDPKSSWRPVGFLDDNPRKRHLRMWGVKVLGRINELHEIAQQVECETVVIAVPSADTDFMLEVSRRARSAGLEVKILPGVNELDERIGISDLRDIDLEGVLARRPIDTNVSSVASYLAGKRVLVTGAGGSIGAELCRQISQFSPAELLMLDRDESALHALRLSMVGIADLDSPSTLLADIRDDERMRKLFRDHRPQVVFHAAALKHVNMLERFPTEAIKTNVFGTLNVLDAAVAASVEKFVNVSTDKAADPVNVLGYTKRVAEGFTSNTAANNSGEFISVRFGNVLGSRGSVLTTFASQIARGGPVTVTDPEVTRYFMMIEEAVQLVIQAAAIGNSGEALVLDMGAPIRIADVAKQLIAQSDRHIEIVYTGLKPGEKLHEDLLGSDESDQRPIHPLISHVPVAPTSREVAQTFSATGDDVAIVAELVAACDHMSTVPKNAQVVHNDQRVVSQ